MSTIAEWLQSARRFSLYEAIAWSLAINLLLFVGSLALGELLVRIFRSRPCASPAPPLTGLEIGLSASCVVLNSLVMFIGIFLYQQGFVTVFTEFTWWMVLRDVAVLVFAMDAAMYLLHRVAHHRWIFPFVHRTHHSYENPRPLTLFVLNPAEVLGFGALWLMVICVYPSTWLGMSIYLAINLIFGTIGHLGVEPFPTGWSAGWTRWISTSSFHAGHHANPQGNYGFYTLIWDYLFGTLSPASTRREAH